MSTASEIEPVRLWDELSELVEIDDQSKITELLEGLSAEEQRHLLAHISEDRLNHLVELLEPEFAAELLEHLPEVQAKDILEDIPASAAADIVEQLPDDVGADLLREMDSEETEAVLAEMDDSEEAESLRERSNYPWDTAGGLMTDSFASVRDSLTIADVVAELSKNADLYKDLDVQYVYVVGDVGELKGVLRLRDLVMTPGHRAVTEIMLTNPTSASVSDSFEALKAVFEDKSYIGLPVVDEGRILKGVISHQTVIDATVHHQTEDYLHVSGIVGGEELRSMPMFLRARRRLAWLAPNIVLNLIAASVIAMHEDTLQAVIALAIFLPIISDMSGCSGNQAVAVSIRELTLGLIRPTEYLRIVFKEGVLGIINGSILGLILGSIAGLWKDNLWLGLVVGGALTLNTILSVLLGGMVPLILKRLKIDPALASGPILTTATDMCGFFLVLNLASMALSKLTL
ncbi:MAG: magnesium transporter [Verrucomicrobiota bacterium]